MEQVGIAQSIPVTRVTVHHKKHSTPIIATYTVVVPLDVKTAEMVTDSIALNIVVQKAVVLSRNRMAPTTVRPTNVCILDATMPEMVIKCTVIYTMIKGVKSNDL